MPVTAASYIYLAALDRVVDGDTLYANVDLGFYVHRIVDVRCRGYNAPERGTPGGPEAAEYLRGLLDGQTFTIQSHKLSSGSPERSFDRWVCDIWLADGRALADVMIAAGHGTAERD